MRRRVYSILSKLIRVFVVKARIVGLREALGRACTICVANHLGSFGPMAIMSSFKTTLYPWVIHQVTDIKTCASYLQKDFVAKELRLRGLLSRVVSSLLGRICVDIMRFLSVIPVYRKGSQIIRTLELSVAYLRQGRAILIFPENDESKAHDELCILEPGFIKLARWLFRATHKAATFLPIAVNRNARAIQVGEPVRFDPEAPFGQERLRIKGELERQITAMYRSLEPGGEDEAGGRVSGLPAAGKGAA